MKKFFYLIIGLFISVTLMAQTDADEEEALAIRIYEAQEKNDEKEFIAAEKAFMDYQLQQHNWEKYYNGWLNRTIFYINNKRYFSAFSDIQHMTDDMKHRNQAKYLYIPNQAMGLYYVNRGNFELGERYLLKALDMSEAINNKLVTVNLYISLAQALSDTDPKEAMNYLDRLPKLDPSPTIQSGVLSYRCIIAYKMGDIKAFNKYYLKYDSIRKKDPVLFNEINYDEVMIYHNLVKKNYNEALAWCDSIDAPSDRADMRFKVYNAMGLFQEAIQELNHKDSLNRIEDNVNVERNLNKLALTISQMEAEHQWSYNRQKKLKMVAALGFILLMLVTIMLYYRHRSNRRLQRQYQLIKEAQEHTKEVLDIRRSFVESMNELLKSPINMLMNYARVLNNPDFHLETNKRAKVHHDIASAAKSIDKLIEPVIDSFLNGDIAISDQQKQLCEDALRSPISSLIGMAEIIADDKDQLISEEDYMQMRSEISRDAYQVAVATQELITFSLLAEGEKVEKNDMVAINEIAKTTLDGHDIRNHQLERYFHTEVSDLIQIKTNQNQLQMLITFLLHNADKYAKHGKISVTCQKDADGSYSIGISNEGDCIPPEDEKQIFQPFVRLSDKSHGIGLGLALARQIADSMEYQIKLDYNYIIGTRFIISGI